MGGPFRSIGLGGWLAVGGLAALALVARALGPAPSTHARERAEARPAVAVDPRIRGHELFAGTPPSGPLPSAGSGEELTALREALRMEQERNARLAASEQAMRRRLDVLSALAVEALDTSWEPLGATPARPLAEVPAPVEAIYVRPAPRER